MTKLWKLISAAMLACVPLCASAQYPPGGPADIAGTFYASNFAGWTIAQGNNGPFAWSSSSVCLKASSGGVGFQPFVVGSPIRIVDTASPSHSENVTVTAVRVNGSGCAITTTVPTFQHLSFYLTSATGGLQEAINFSKQNYGVSPSLGVAIATADWERLGGTTAMITGAAGGSNVSILDLRTSCPVAYTWNGSVYTGINLCNSGGTTTLTLTTTGTSGPSTLTGDPTAGYALNVPNYATEFQVNGVDNLSQTLLDLDQGNNITITNTSGGHVRIDGLSGASIMPQVIPPIAGQYVVLYPSTGTLTNDEPGGSSISSTSGNFGWQCSGIFCSIAPHTTANWSGFVLPSYVLPGNVTAIYADAITSGQTRLGRMPFSGANTTSFGCGGSSQLLPIFAPASPWLATEATQLLSIPATSIASLSCPIDLGASSNGSSGETINVSAIRLIVFYTGTAPPVDARVQIVPPLTFNADLNQLLMDPLGVGFLQPLTVLTLPTAASSTGKIFQVTDGTSSSDCTSGGGSTVNLCRSNGTTWAIFSSGGGGGLSGQTTGFLPLATSATASTTSSALEDTGSSLVYHGTGTQHGLSFAASSGGLITPVAGSAGLGTDASGLWNAYENGGSWSRLCTVGNVQCTGGGGGTPQYIAPQAIAGCGVEYVSGLTYTVGACNYSINGVTYNSPLSNITLPAADATNPEIDVIFVDTTGVVQVIQGTPAVTPQQPVVDPSTQLQLTFVLVPATATTPANTTSVLIFDEGTEWTAAKGGTSSANVNLASTNNPYHGTIDTEFGAGGTVATTTFAQYTDPSAGTVTLGNYNNLTLYLRNKAAWPKTRSVTVQWYNGTTALGTAVVLSNGAFGLDATGNVTSYQQISIPASTFGIAGTPATTVRLTVSGSGSNLTGFYVDEVSLQGGNGGVVLPTTLMNFRGPWSATATYQPNDTVVSGGIGYVALAANTNTAVSTTATWSALAPPAGTGTVTSVAQTVPSWLSVSGSPVTGAGTLAITAATGQTSHQVLGTCGTATSFAPCTLVAGDIPAALSSSTSVNGTSIPASVTLAQTIASGTSALGTSAIASGTCATVVTTSATGTATTDVVPWGFNADPTSTTGYSPSASGMLTIIAYPTANNVNFKVCNNTSASITPGAVTLNWRIAR